MPTLDEVASIACALPEVVEVDRGGYRVWSVCGKTFAWERPFTKADIRRFGKSDPPEGPILAVRVRDVLEEEAILAEESTAFFTIPHFDGFPGVLIQLRAVKKRVLREAIQDAWSAQAPARLSSPKAVI